ncbi:MAG: hypothetical protein GY880_27345 [Planctomycetaceae bacterium]|nr:hypothetical protein [Planctomycetaceae bacterium]
MMDIGKGTEEAKDACPSFFALQSNCEEGVTGHFWERRYWEQRLLDETQVLTRAVHIDLNPIRAASAEDFVSSQFTGTKDRIDDLRD